MENAALYISVATLTRIIFPAIYLFAAFIVYRWFMPQMSTVARRLAGFMLAAQALAIAKTLYIQPASSFDQWLWQLQAEWNAPATLAATQLALVGCIALLSSWLCKPSMPIQRLYFLGLGLVFLFLAYDEFFTLHEHFASWNYYLALGMGVVAATLLVAARSPHSSWRWHACLLAGLAISAFGAIQVERFGSPCGDFGLLYIGECPTRTAWELEEILEFLGIWLTLIAALGHFSNLSPPSTRLIRALYLLPALWILLLTPIAPIWSVAQQSYSQAAAVAFASGTGLQAYRIETRERSFTVHLFLSPQGWDYKGLGYSIHLIDQISGQSIVSRNTQAHRRLEFYLAPGHIPVYRQWKRIWFPPETPTNHALSLVLTLWHKAGEQIVYDRVLSSDLELLSDAQVVLGELILPSSAPPPTTPPLARFANGFSLGAVDMPQSAQAGEDLLIPFDWRSSENGSEDHVQFLHLGYVSPLDEGKSGEGEAQPLESGAWFVYDQQPLGARLPTRLWYSGLADSETWRVPLPADLAPGQYSAFTGIYRARDGQRVPASDAEGQPYVDARVPLGYVIIRNLPP